MRTHKIIKAVITTIPALALMIILSGCGEGLVSPPLSATFRDGVSSGRVLIVKNTSVKVINNVTVKVTDGVTGKENLGKVAYSIDPGSTTEVGWLQIGSNLKKGDTVRVYCDGFPLGVSFDVN